MIANWRPAGTTQRNLASNNQQQLDMYLSSPVVQQGPEWYRRTTVNNTPFQIASMRVGGHGNIVTGTDLNEAVLLDLVSLDSAVNCEMREKVLESWKEGGRMRLRLWEAWREEEAAAGGRVWVMERMAWEPTPRLRLRALTYTSGLGVFPIKLE